MSGPEADDVHPEEIHHLLDFFSKKSYRANGEQRNDPLADKCVKLFSRDYQVSIINNNGGGICAHYPSKLVLQEYQKTSMDAERVESMYDANKLRELYKLAKFARCRSRVVVPVIMFEGKHVCRSATLSGGMEMYSRSGLDFFFTGSEQPSSSSSGSSSSSNPRSPQADSQSDYQMFDQVRGSDIQLLKMFQVKYIVDLMMEKKKVKFGMNITSSEKVDKKNRYGEFCILSIPYPGCEFFREWKDNSYMGEEMKFDWSQGFVDAELDIPQTELLSQLTTDWTQYRHWNLIQITQNYLKMLIHMLIQGDRGILVHCISGWDRTPMFVSLMRLSLWADGAIHKSLSAYEILYLTLAYDWYLFGHSLSDRLNKGEEIMLFCFYFLTYITSEEFTVAAARSSKSRHNSSTDTHPSNHTFPQDPRLPHRSSGGSACSGGRRRNTSSSSISSNGSFSVEPPSSSTFYLNPDEEEELEVVDDFVQPICTGMANHRLEQHCSSGSAMAPGLHQSHSSPVNVPGTRARQSSMSASPCGSWQVISNTGSLLNSEQHSTRSGPDSNISTIVADSLIYGTPLANRVDPDETAPTGAVSSGSTLFANMSNHVTMRCEEVTDRWEKLDTVRRIFYNAYNHKISSKLKPDSSLQNLFGHFAEKMGKPFKGFY